MLLAPSDNVSLDAAIDRMLRARTVSDDALPTLLSSVLGRAVPPTAVHERRERVEAAECAESLSSHDGPAFERGVFMEVCYADETRPAHYSYPPGGIGQSMADLTEWLTAETAVPREEGAEARPQWWSLVKCATIRVRQDTAFVAEMLAQLDTVWTGGVLRYRADPAAYDAEIRNAAVKKRVLAAPKPITKRALEKIQDAALMNAYAFVELEEEEDGADSHRAMSNLTARGHGE
eukprot:gene17738-24098_t